MSQQYEYTLNATLWQGFFYIFTDLFTVNSAIILQYSTYAYFKGEALKIYDAVLSSLYKKNIP